MTLPPCPIAGHDNPHHWHPLDDVRGVGTPTQHPSETHVTCKETYGVSRCYSAHVPEPTEPTPLVTLPTVDQIAEAIVMDCEPAEPTADEWVRVPVGTTIPEGVTFRNEYVAVPNHFPVQPDEIAYLRRSDLDRITAPKSTPAEKLAEALTQLVIGAEDAWLPADVQSALDAAGLTLAERGEK